QVVLDLLLELDLAAEMRQREPRMNRRRHVLRDALRSEELVELLLAVDPVCVLIAERLCPLEQRVLNRLQRRSERRDEFAACDGLLVLRCTIAPTGEDRILLDIARADLEPDGHAFLDPVPDLLPAALIALVDNDIDRPVREALRAQLV